MSHPPTPTETDGEAANPGPRPRQRGPRSYDAAQRRRQRGAEPATFRRADFTVWHCNVQGFASSSAELAARVRLADTAPVLICLNETFLDRSVEQVSMEGYAVVARRDRDTGQRCGGVLVLARQDIAQSVTLVCSSPTAERVWLLVHSDTGPFLVCAWYRPPSPGDATSVVSFCQEWRSLRDQALGTVVLGDLNVHQTQWLRHSLRNSPEGKALETFCTDNGFRQRVHEPTRGDNLLDLVLTDLANVECTVLPRIADHSVVTATLHLNVPKHQEHRREVWRFAKADWERLQSELDAQDWEQLRHTTPTDGATWLTDCVLQHARNAIPTATVTDKKRTHPWLTDGTLTLVAAKQQATGTAREHAAAEACSRGIAAEYHKYVSRTREELRVLRTGSKLWWTKTRELLHYKSKDSSLPALKATNGTWVLEPQEKANELERSFNAKNASTECELNDYTSLHLQNRLALDEHELTNDAADDVLRRLNVDSATGPDKLPTRVLKHCAPQLAKPLLLLARRILDTGEWPDCWRTHWIVPLHKRKSVFQPQNYRGIHLTTQLAKAVERLIGRTFQRQLEADGRYGANQFAYTKCRGARDALAYLTLTWILALNTRKDVAVYCSDVSGAFDHVSAKRLVEKLHATGLDAKLVAVFESWMQQRLGHVVVGGQQSAGMRLYDMVFQGTVWGPVLWNVFFADAKKALSQSGFEEIVYADDLNAFRLYDRPPPTAADTATTATDNARPTADATTTADAASPTTDVQGDLLKCQTELHRWGRANGVRFDATRESTHMISLANPSEGTFKLLGATFDTRLTMKSCVDELVHEASWRLTSVLRGRTYQTTAELVAVYKAKVLSYVETRTPAVYHASDSVLKRIDALQHRLLRELGVSAGTAIHDWNLAPLETRRDIAMLGVIHRAVLGMGPPHLRRFFRLAAPAACQRTRADVRRHHRHLEDPREGRYLEVLRRSALGLIGVYNLLPSDVVDAPSVQPFQRLLQALVQGAEWTSVPNWHRVLSPRLEMASHPLLRLASPSPTPTPSTRRRPPLAHAPPPTPT